MAHELVSLLNSLGKDSVEYCALCLQTGNDRKISTSDYLNTLIEELRGPTTWRWLITTFDNMNVCQVCETYLAKTMKIIQRIRFTVKFNKLMKMRNDADSLSTLNSILKVLNADPSDAVPKAVSNLQRTVEVARECAAAVKEMKKIHDLRKTETLLVSSNAAGTTWASPTPPSTQPAPRPARTPAAPDDNDYVIIENNIQLKENDAQAKEEDDDVIIKPDPEPDIFVIDDDEEPEVKPPSPVPAELHSSRDLTERLRNYLLNSQIDPMMNREPPITNDPLAMNVNTVSNLNNIADLLVNTTNPIILPREVTGCNQLLAIKTADGTGFVMHQIVPAANNELYVPTIPAKIVNGQLEMLNKVICSGPVVPPTLVPIVFNPPRPVAPPPRPMRQYAPRQKKTLSDEELSNLRYNLYKIAPPGDNPLPKYNGIPPVTCGWSYNPNSKPSVTSNRGCNPSTMSHSVSSTGNYRSPVNIRPKPPDSSMSLMISNGAVSGNAMPATQRGTNLLNSNYINPGSLQNNKVLAPNASTSQNNKTVCRNQDSAMWKDKEAKEMATKRKNEESTRLDAEPAMKMDNIDWEAKIPMDVITYMDATDPQAQPQQPPNSGLGSISNVYSESEDRLAVASIEAELRRPHNNAPHIVSKVISID